MEAAKARSEDDPDNCLRLGDVVDLGGCVGAQLDVARVAADRRIVPGERIGPISLGMYLDDVVKILGQPDRAERAPGAAIKYFYDRHGLFVGARDVPAITVQVVSTNNNGYVTEQGIRVGSSGADFVRAYGDRYRNLTREQGSECLSACLIYYPDLQTTFEIDSRNNSVTQIGVSRAYAR